jgi:hypothetical protein
VGRGGDSLACLVCVSLVCAGLVRTRDVSEVRMTSLQQANSCRALATDILPQATAFNYFLQQVTSCTCPLFSFFPSK